MTSSSAARGKNHHRVQPGDGAGARRIACAADRRRHAPAGPASDHGRGERDRPVAPARRTGAGPRSGAATTRAEPVRDHRRADSPESVRVARLGADEELHREPARAVRVGRARYAARCLRSPMRWWSRARCRGGIRRRLGDDPPRPRRARARNPPRRQDPVDRRGAEPGRFRSQQVPLLALLRLPLPELLRHGSATPL